MSPRHEDLGTKILAKWRRQGYGVWHITFVIEGFDEQEIHLLPGKLSKTFATGLARLQCARRMGVKRDHVIVKEITKES